MDRLFSSSWKCDPARRCRVGPGHLSKSSLGLLIGALRHTDNKRIVCIQFPGMREIWKQPPPASFPHLCFSTSSCAAMALCTWSPVLISEQGRLPDGERTVSLLEWRLHGPVSVARLPHPFCLHCPTPRSQLLPLGVCAAPTPHSQQFPPRWVGPAISYLCFSTLFPAALNCNPSF